MVPLGGPHRPTLWVVVPPPPFGGGGDGPSPSFGWEKSSLGPLKGPHGPLLWRVVPGGEYTPPIVGIREGQVRRKRGKGKVPVA